MTGSIAKAMPLRRLSSPPRRLKTATLRASVIVKVAIQLRGKRRMSRVWFMPVGGLRYKRRKGSRFAWAETQPPNATIRTASGRLRRDSWLR